MVCGERLHTNHAINLLAKMSRRYRRRNYAFGLLIMLLLIAASLTGLNFVTSPGWIAVFQILIPILCIGAAGILVSLPARIVRSKILLTAIFLLLVVFGIYVYSPIVATSDNPLVKVLLPFNSTLASFFPSRGDYSMPDWDSVYDDPQLFTLYNIFHALTYFYAGWLGFSLFGRKLLNRAAICLTPRRHKNLIWGYSDGAFELAKNMMRDPDGEGAPIFIIGEELEFEPDQEKRIFDTLSNEGIIVIDTNYDNLSEDERDFRCKPLSWHRLRRLFSSGKYFSGFRHYFITENQDFNVHYAILVLNQLGLMRDRLKGKSHIFVRSEQEGIDVFFQKKLNENPGLAGKVEVHIFNQSDLTARQFVENYPVLDLAKRTNPATGRKCLTVDTDTLTVNGEVNILLLGLGWTGFELLKKEVGDSRFLGDFRLNIVVVDNDYSLHHGRFQYIVSEAARFGVNICINPLVWLDDRHTIVGQWLSGEKCGRQQGLEEKRVDQANGQLFYEWLGFEDPETSIPNILNFNRIIVALGSDELNVNTALQLTKFRNSYLGAKVNLDTSLMPEPIFAHVRDKERYSYYEKYAFSPIYIFGGLKSIYSVDNLVDERMDSIAKLVNYVYDQCAKPEIGEAELLAALRNGTAEQKWAKCSIFDQDSSRGVAMNMRNIVTIAGGIERLKAFIKNPATLERLAELEHKRWNAFHVMRGIGTWEIPEVESVYINGALKTNGKLYISSSLTRHISLVDYDRLDEASECLHSLGNTGADFKDADRRIVRHFPIFFNIKSQSKTSMDKTYTPKPIDTSDVELPESLDELAELIAENVHEVWSQNRMNEGWSYGAARDDNARKHPCLLPYDELPESEKEYDRATSRETIKLILKLGFKIVPPTK